MVTGQNKKNMYCSNLVFKDHLSSSVLWQHYFISNFDTDRHCIPFLKEKASFHSETYLYRVQPTPQTHCKDKCLKDNEAYRDTLLVLPGPTATTVACSTFPWAFSGIMMPPLVTVSAAKRSTNTRSNMGRNFRKACCETQAC